VRYPLVLIAVAATQACGDSTGPSRFINVEGTFAVQSFDGAPAWSMSLVFIDPSGAVVDTAARFSMVEMRMDFLDQNSDPARWDNAKLIAVMRCEALSRDFDCSTTEWSWDQQHAYRATFDSLFLRSPDFGPDPWARVPWLQQESSFEVPFPLEADHDVLLTFVRRAN
jgi:hypothetical protein